jgi:superfamily II DNA or RNA helicase
VVGIEFHGQLKDYQQEAAEAVLEKDFATLLGGPKSGKTVVALYVIAQRRQPTLIIIPTLALLDGWVRKIVNFLQIPAEEIGIVSNGTLRRGKVVTLAHTGEVAKQWRQLREHVGAIIVDECQRCPARVIAQLLPNFDARYVLGLASSNQRRDGLSRFIYYYLGDIAYTIHEKDAKEGRGIIPAAVVARLTEFQYPYTSRADYHPMLIALMSDAERSRRIADDIQRELREAPQMALVLSGGDEHNRLLMELLKERGIDVMVYGHSLGQTSDMDGGADPSVLPRLPAPDQPLAILMTPQVLMRTFRNLSARLLFLALPVYFRGRLAHAIRSLHVCDNGDCTGPPLKIYDYVDQRVPLLDNYFRMRSYNYGTHPESILRSH